jgi:DNA-binding CsgD family transcriptional regulator
MKQGPPTIEMAIADGHFTKCAPESSTTEPVQLRDKEITILKLICDEKSTKEIADIVDLSPRTVEDIRLKLKAKTGTKSTVGLIMYAIKAGLVKTA